MSIIAVAMSGGVDSSVAAAMLKQQGHNIIGITMRLFTPHDGSSCSPTDDAAAMAQQLGIPHYSVDFEANFRDQVINNFIEEYKAGHTPNPCLRCNRYIKFGLLLDRARELGADFLATGHYVRKSVDPDGACHMHTAANIRKDQSYFLYTLTQQQLQQVIFPLGDIESKDDVRNLARGFNLKVADKSDSQEVCFIPDDDYVAFLEGFHSFGALSGNIVHVDGQIVGRHRGTHRYTIGQRKGLGIAWKEPLYVIAIDAEQNVVVVGEQQHVYGSSLKTSAASWIIAPKARNFAATCKIRYRHQPVSCQVQLLDDDRCIVHFAQAQKSITPGQSLVIYQGDEVLGGALIESVCD